MCVRARVCVCVCVCLLGASKGCAVLSERSGISDVMKGLKLGFLMYEQLMLVNLI